MPVRMFGEESRGLGGRCEWAEQSGDGLKGRSRAGREEKVWRGSEGGGGGIKTVICNSFCSVSVCLCINGITSCRVCVFVGRLCVLIHQCARPD